MKLHVPTKVTVVVLALLHLAAHLGPIAYISYHFHLTSAGKYRNSNDRLHLLTRIDNVLRFGRHQQSDAPLNPHWCVWR